LEAERETSETWATGAHLALRPVLSFPLGTPRARLTLSVEVGGRLGMSNRPQDNAMLSDNELLVSGQLGLGFSL